MHIPVPVLSIIPIFDVHNLFNKIKNFSFFLLLFSSPESILPLLKFELKLVPVQGNCWLRRKEVNSFTLIMMEVIYSIELLILWEYFCKSSTKEIDFSLVPVRPHNQSKIMSTDNLLLQWWYRQPRSWRGRNEVKSGFTYEVHDGGRKNGFKVQVQSKLM